MPKTGFKKPKPRSLNSTVTSNILKRLNNNFNYELHIKIIWNKISNTYISSIVYTVIWSNPPESMRLFSIELIIRSRDKSKQNLKTYIKGAYITKL